MVTKHKIIKHNRLASCPLKAAISIALATWGSTTAWSQEMDQHHDRDVEEVHVTGQRSDGYKTDTLSSPQYTADLLDTAKTVNVITAEVMRDQGTDSLSDILSNVPGISMQAGEGGAPPGDQLSIRGFSARTDIFIDGARDFGGYSRDSYNLERVEVAKGPGSSYTGRGSTGGSINMVTKTAQAEDLTHGTVGLGNADYKRLSLDMNRQLTDTSAIRLNLLAHDADTPDRDEAESTRYGFAPSITFGLGSDTRYLLSYSYLEQDNIPDYGIPWVSGGNTALAEYANQIAPVDDSNWYGLTERDYENVRNHLLTARIEHVLNDNISISNQLRWGETDRDSIVTAPRFNSNDSTDIRRTDWKSRDQKDRIINNLTSLSMSFNTGGIAHTLATGLELSEETEVNFARDITGSQPVTDLFSPAPGDVWGGTVFRTGGKTESNGFSASAYLADTLAFNENWLLTAGLRWDRFKLDYTDIEDNGDIAEYERTDSEFSYQGSLVFKPVPYGSIYAGYGTSFNPSGEGLSLTTRGGDLAEVDPEQSKTYELGTKWELLDQHLFLSAALFRTAKTNARESDPVTSGLTVLSGEQVVKGIELGVVGRLTDVWNIVAGYTWMDGEITESVDPATIGRTLSNTPEHTFNLWTSYQVIPALEVGFGTQYVDDRYSNTSNERVAPGYQLYNAMITYAVNPNLSFRLNANNLTGKDYIGNVGGGHSIPGDGRSVILSVSFSR